MACSSIRRRQLPELLEGSQRQFVVGAGLANTATVRRRHQGIGPRQSRRPASCGAIRSPDLPAFNFRPVGVAGAAVDFCDRVVQRTEVRFRFERSLVEIEGAAILASLHARIAYQRKPFGRSLGRFVELFEGGLARELRRCGRDRAKLLGSCGVYRGQLPEVCQPPPPGGQRSRARWRAFLSTRRSPAAARRPSLTTGTAFAGSLNSRYAAPEGKQGGQAIRLGTEELARIRESILDVSQTSDTRARDSSASRDWKVMLDRVPDKCEPRRRSALAP